MYTIGNLRLAFSGDRVWGVEAVRQFDTIDVYGPFISELEASNFAHGKLIDQRDPDSYQYASMKVVEIEMRPVESKYSRIVLRDGKYQYEQE